MEAEKFLELNIYYKPNIFNGFFTTFIEFHAKTEIVKMNKFLT